jgi:hypothetical protein
LDLQNLRKMELTRLLKKKKKNLNFHLKMANGEFWREHSIRDLHAKFK